MVLSNRLTPAAPSCGVKALGESGSVGIQARCPSLDSHRPGWAYAFSGIGPGFPGISAEVL